MAVHSEVVVDTQPRLKPLQIRTSPRNSTSAAETSHSPRTPASPFLHNLHHRFRKNSNASSSLSSDAPSTSNAPTQLGPAERAEAVVAAKRFLHTILRNDWEFPVADPDTPGSDDSSRKEEILSARAAVAWQVRQEAPSDIDLDSDSPTTGKARRRKRKGDDVYKFENPNAIAASIKEKKVKRRRKIEAEMQWNDGLTLWSARRDAWTRAQEHVPTKRPSSGSHGSWSGENNSQSGSERISHDTQISAHAPAHSQNPEWPLPADVSEASPPTATSIVKVDTQNPVSSTLIPLPEKYPADSPDGPFLPIYPPIFPTEHALRSRIKPAAYPTIYSKVVLQSLCPNVPIPLTHMIGALVDGWKSEGNWPQQTMAERQAEVSRKVARKGETAFGRWRREQEEKRTMVKRANDMAAVTQTGDHDVGDENEKRGFRKSISGAVRKVLGVQIEHETDGGLERLGIKFSENEDAIEDGPLVEEQPQLQTVSTTAQTVYT